MGDPRLDLDKVIRPTLIRLEDSIIFSLFERSHFKINYKIYVPGAIKIPDFNGSFFDFLLYGTEAIHAKAGRYAHPEEHAFSQNLSVPVIDRKEFDRPIKETDININNRISEAYFEALKKICDSGDDKHYGSAAVCDIDCLQKLSRRIHYGTYVAEAKFQQDSENYVKLIQAGDVEAIIEKLTNKKVESAVLQRVAEKGERYQIDSKFIADFYREKVIPMTIDVEVEYFMKRDK
jgi:chorismate mutase